MKVLLYLCFLTWAGSCSLRGEALRVDSILASVNGSPLSLLDVVDETGGDEARLRMMYSGATLETKVRQLRRAALDEMIDRRLVVEDYENDPFDIPGQHIEDMIDKLSLNFSDGTRKSLKRKAEASGLTLNDLQGKARDKVIVDYMLGTLFFKEETLTPREIHEYYEANKARFTAADSIRLQVLFLSPDNPRLEELKREIGKDLKSGNDKIFNSLVMLHSAAPNASKGGDLGWIETDKLRPEFARAVRGRSSGFISEAVETPEGIYFLRLAEQTSGGVRSFSEVKGMLAEELRAERRRIVYKNYIAKLRKQAIIRYFIGD